MAGKTFIICASFLIVQISGQCIGNVYNPGCTCANPSLAYAPSCPNAGLAYGTNCAANGLAVAGLGSGIVNGCGAPIPSAASFPPTGMSIYSDNILIEGPVVVGGLLPFSGTVALEGIMPSAGAGVVSYSCGTGAIGIVNEIGGPAAGLSYNGLVGPGVGCGCGAYY